METLSDVALSPSGIGATLDTDDLARAVAEPAGLAEMQRLLDERLVLHIRSGAPPTRAAVAELSFHLGVPRDPARWPAPRRVGPDGPPPQFSFIADFGARADTSGRPPRPQSYIDRLHQDGISAYSVSVSFDPPAPCVTRFVDLRAVYESLPAGLKRFVETHHALHANMATPQTPYADLPAFDPEHVSRRPLVVRHWRTGAPVLHLPRNPDSRIEGMDAEASREVIAELWEHAEGSPARLDVALGENELVVWDGMGALHTNPPYPRDRDHRFWFLIIPVKAPALEPAFS
jgi:hypothetical protein